jgi:hypothetical protein
MRGIDLNYTPQVINGSMLEMAKLIAGPLDNVL